MTTPIDQVRGWLAGAQRVVALTGAGISTDSGIPDYRELNARLMAATGWQVVAVPGVAFHFRLEIWRVGPGARSQTGRQTAGHFD